MRRRSWLVAAVRHVQAQSGEKHQIPPPAAPSPAVYTGSRGLSLADVGSGRMRGNKKGARREGHKSSRIGKGGNAIWKNVLRIAEQQRPVDARAGGRAGCREGFRTNCAAEPSVSLLSPVALSIHVRLSVGLRVSTPGSVFSYLSFGWSDGARVGRCLGGRFQFVTLPRSPSQEAGIFEFLLRFLNFVSAPLGLRLDTFLRDRVRK